MFAVIRTGGKQYRVAAEDVIKVNKTDQTRVYAILYGQGIIPYYKLTPIIARTS